jgi:molybdopterin-containing oxidoreductase family iron-sulfur binding subunit
MGCLLGLSPQVTAQRNPKRGRGLALLVESLPSPTYQATLAAVLERFPQARIFMHEPVSRRNRDEGARLVGAAGRRMSFDLDQADVIVSVDADFLGVEGDTVRNAALFAAGRRLAADTDSRMSRLYSVEPSFTITGMNADHRLRLAGSQVGSFLRHLAAETFGDSAELPYALRSGLADDATFSEREQRMIRALAADLRRSGNNSVVIVGERQPAWVHALGHVFNAALGSIGRVVQYVDHTLPFATGDLEDLRRAVDQQEIETLFVLGTNPVLTAPTDVGFDGVLSRIPMTVHLSHHVDETSQHCHWHLPRAHYLEVWGDLRATDGSVTIQQPLISPLFGSKSELDLVGRLVSMNTAGRYAEVGVDRDLGYELVRAHYAGAVAADEFEGRWQHWLHDGLVDLEASPPEPPAFDFAALGEAMPTASARRPFSESLEVVFQADPSVYDGRYANNGWLQELPDPMTKLTWDNAAYISPATATELGLEMGDLVNISLGTATLRIAVMPAPGTADNVVVLPLGYGRRSETMQTCQDVGFDTYGLRSSTAWFGLGARIANLYEEYPLASTQDHGRMETGVMDITRPMVREATLAAYAQDPAFVRHFELVDNEELRSVFQPSVVREGRQWGMTIDLNACIGCNACAIACQAENNVPVVTKERVLMGREMHWLRVDRYYTGDENDSQAVTQPMPCQQCENAPCETVCPVTATAHSPEGLNDMAYNRCIGTRYCSNNCPYKVRRFNYFNYARENDERAPLHRLQNNPDVTVRFRGVMEKCTYCVQRINQAKHAHHRVGDDVIPDGEIMSACQQACPTQAIVFGDINDTSSQVASLKRLGRNYTLLAELNNVPRTSYLGRVRNINPELV